MQCAENDSHCALAFSAHLRAWFASAERGGGTGGGVTRGGGTGRREWEHGWRQPQGDMHMVVAWLGCRTAMVVTKSRVAIPHSASKGRGLVTSAAAARSTGISFTRIAQALRPHNYLE